jgi:hypothetical protein
VTRVLASSPTIRLILATTTPVDEGRIVALKNQSLEDYSKGGPSFAYARSPRGCDTAAAIPEGDLICYV